MDEDEIISSYVLENDTDIDDDSLTAILMNASGNGTLICNPDGTFIYSPNDNFVSVDGFTYACNGILENGYYLAGVYP
jgi:hypothetical protein